MCLGKTRVPKEVSAEKKVMPKSPRKCTSFRETKVTSAVISASPKAVMMASMLRLEVLVDG